MEQYPHNIEMLMLQTRLWEVERTLEKYREALQQIAHFPCEPIWRDSISDSAEQMLNIADEALRNDN